MGGLCDEGRDFLRLCKKRNKGATMHLLDVLVTQHAKWTAKRVRRGLLGQSIVDFSTASWSAIQLKESTKDSASQQHKAPPKKTPRLLRSFAKAGDAVKSKRSLPLVPGMSQYGDSQDVDMDVGFAQNPSSLSFSTDAASQKKVPQEFDIFSTTSEIEESTPQF